MTLPAFDRRSVLLAGAALTAAPAFAVTPKRSSPAFPQGFLWGAATAPHQIEGNNVASDLWYLENQQPTVFTTPSGDACNSFALWETDLDLARNLGLNCYRFGIEWARIEPEKGLFSQAMLDHYKAMIDGCRARGLAPVVTYSHFTAPRWFSAQGGWTNPESAQLFARYCDKATRALGQGIHSAITFNEPNILLLLKPMLPPQVWDIQKLTLETAARRLGVPKFVSANVAGLDDLPALQRGLLAAHAAGKAAIKAVRPNLPVGLSLAMIDDQAVGKASIRDRMRGELYGAWLDVARGDDFLGVQNYERALWGDKGRLPAPAGAVVNWSAARSGRPRSPARSATRTRRRACRSWSPSTASAPTTTRSAPASSPRRSPGSSRRSTTGFRCGAIATGRCSTTSSGSSATSPSSACTASIP